MRLLLTSLLALLFATACSKRGADSVQAEPSADVSSEPPDFQTPDDPKPPAIVKLADAYLASLAPEQRPNEPESARDDFVRSFFIGFTTPTGSMSGGTDADTKGFTAGQEFRRANPQKLKETFESFGYVATEAEGLWTLEFEHSGFKPRGCRNDKEWWLDDLGDTVYELPNDQKIPDEGISIRISGFLSPKGQYGHLGLYKHRFYATKISKSNGG